MSVVHDCGSSISRGLKKNVDYSSSSKPYRAALQHSPQNPPRFPRNVPTSSGFSSVMVVCEKGPYFPDRKRWAVCGCWVRKGLEGACPSCHSCSAGNNQIKRASVFDTTDLYGALLASREKKEIDSECSIRRQRKLYAPDAQTGTSDRIPTRRSETACGAARRD